MEKKLECMIILFLLLGLLLLASCVTLPNYDYQGHKTQVITGSSISKTQQGTDNNNSDDSTAKEIIEKPPIPEFDSPCLDTDYGVAYTIAATCYDKKVHITGTSDYCEDSNYLIEFYCSNNLEDGCLKTKPYFCNKTAVCYRGACVDFKNLNNSININVSWS